MSYQAFRRIPILVAFAACTPLPLVAAPPDALLAPPTPAGPIAPGTAPRPDFDTLDVDDDARLSRAEVATETLLAERFDAHDRDNDGALTRSEYEDYVALAADTGRDSG